MTTEIEEQNHEAASELTMVEPMENEVEQKMVPLSALEAERRKRQEAEAQRNVYQEFMNRYESQQQVEQEPEDPNGLVENQVLKNNTAASERRILETLYQDMNPKAVQDINKYLKPILEKKPWLAQTVDAAQNRYARAYEIVQDYMHMVEEKPQARQYNNNDGHRIIQNAQKPRSPTEVGKSARPEGFEYLKSIQGKKEFRDYRQKVLRGEA